MRILIAEDEERSRRGLAEVIGSIGERFQVCAQASNGKQAAHLAMRFRPDVVITDIRMPFMDGLELIRELRSKKCEARFVIVSAFAEFEYAKQGIELGVADYLVKPVSYEAVERTLRKLEESVEENRASTTARSSLGAEFPDAHPTVRRALSEIEKNFSDRVGLEDLAQKLRISPEYLSTLFHRDTGMTFSAFLRNYRIAQAKDLIVDGGLDAGEVARAVGYVDPKYFARVFKEVVGVSPIAYFRGEMPEAGHAE